MALRESFAQHFAHDKNPPRIHEVPQAELDRKTQALRNILGFISRSSLFMLFEQAERLAPLNRVTQEVADPIKEYANKPEGFTREIYSLGGPDVIGAASLLRSGDSEVITIGQHGVTGVDLIHLPPYANQTELQDALTEMVLSGNGLDVPDILEQTVREIISWEDQLLAGQLFERTAINLHGNPELEYAQSERTHAFAPNAEDYAKLSTTHAFALSLALMHVNPEDIQITNETHINYRGYSATVTSLNIINGDQQIHWQSISDITFPSDGPLPLPVLEIISAVLDQTEIAPEDTAIISKGSMSIGIQGLVPILPVGTTLAFDNQQEVGRVKDLRLPMQRVRTLGQIDPVAFPSVEQMPWWGYAKDRSTITLATVSPHPIFRRHVRAQHRQDMLSKLLRTLTRKR